MKKTLNNKLIVIKVGTNVLIKNGQDSEELDFKSFKLIAEQIKQLVTNGYSVVVVSSAAITAGMMVSKIKTRPINIVDQQRLASIGWRYILNYWHKALDGPLVGEVLTTKSELDLTHERNELLSVIHNLLLNNCIPIINENDAIAHEEITFGDNDTLAAILASKFINSDKFSDNVSLVLLSDVDGVLEVINDPKTLIKKIEDIKPFMHLAKESTSQNSRGGMITKFTAAKIATNNGISTYITNGKKINSINNALNKKTGTFFKPNR